MLVDRKIFKISDNSFQNVHIILANQDINLKMQDFDEIYNFLKTFFLDENSVTKLTFNYKLDSGLDIKAYYEITHNPSYITLNYRDLACFPCNVLPQKLIIRILNRSSAINNLTKNLSEHVNKNISSGEHFNLASKLSKCIDKEEIDKCKNKFFKTPHNFSHEDQSICIKGKVLKSTDKLYSNYLFKNNIDKPKMEVNSVCKQINENELNNRSNNLYNDVFKDTKINNACLDTKSLDNNLSITLENNFYFPEKNTKVVDESMEICMNAISINKNIINFGDNSKKYINNLENEINLNKEMLISCMSNNTESNAELIQNTNSYTNEVLGEINCTKVNKNDDKHGKIEINSLVMPKLNVITIENMSSNEPDNKPLNNINEINNINLSSMFNECNNIKIGNSSSQVSSASMDHLDFEIDSDFKPKICKTKLRLQRNKRKLNFEPSMKTSLKHPKSDNGNNEKFIDDSNETNSNEVTKFNDLTNTYLYDCKYFNSNTNKKRFSKPSRSQKLEKEEIGLLSLAVIDLTGESTPPTKFKTSIKKESISNKSKRKSCNLKNYTFNKRKPTKFNISTPVKVKS